MFHGLFIGVDRYSSPLVSDLTCAARDAKALYGLFADTFGDSSCALLLDGAATRAAVLNAFGQLSTVGTDDLVFIHFSGHGSDIHHLMTADADPMALDASAIHLEELVNLFRQIPARNVLLCLDCCFAGGAGAKVFHAPVASRDATSTEALLQKIGGAGRVIFTAAGADQEALEDRRRGHGVFTYFLMQALRGAPEVIEAGAVTFLSLLQFVTQRVEAAAAQFQHAQQPGIRGTIDGEVRLPVLTPSRFYKSFFPDASTTVVSADVNDLLAHGFPQDVIDAIKQAVPKLNALQLSAVNDMRLLDGEHLVVSAPTSSGKTMIGELAAVRASLRGERTYVLLPLRALVNDKYGDLKGKYGPLGMRVIRSTGEIADDNDALMRGKFDIALLTYERFATLAVTTPFILRNVGLVVVDEVQMITDVGRGANLEFLLTLLRSQRTIGVEPQIVALSAVIGDTNGFDKWLGARLLVSAERPVPLEEGTLNLSGDYHFIATDGKEQRAARYVQPEFRKGSSQDVIIPLVRRLVADGEKVIVFRETKVVVRATAAYLSHSLGIPPATKTLAELPTGDPSSASALLRQCLQGGVAFHNADLERGEREAIEASFRDPTGEVKVLVATTTLAMGVNTPAWTVVIEGLTHPGGDPYTVAEYKNMVGRAGRLGWSPKGKAFLVAAAFGEEGRLWNSYVLGKPENLVSRFGQQRVLSAVCRVLATASASRAPGLDTPTIVRFLQSSFGAYQTGRSWTQTEVERALNDLTRGALVEAVEGKYRLTPLGAVAGQLGIEVDSVARIARALRGVPIASIRAGTIVAATLATSELDDVYMPIHKTSHKERQRWQAVPSQQGLPQSLIRELRHGSDAEITARCKKLASTMMWIQGVELDRLEASLLQHMGADNAAGPIRSAAERTRDLVSVVGRVVSILNNAAPREPEQLWDTVDELLVQLELGVPAELVWLGREMKRGMDRGEYLALKRAALTSAKAIDAASEDVLAASVSREAVRRRIIEIAKATLDAVERDDLPMPAPPRA
jgi:helicase